jgi:(E)-4-hydroxy-3-methylbut-2-enyl-diphosphate synthase
VGAAPGRVSIYKNKDLIRKNIPTADALPALIEIIKENGDWREP